MKFALVFKMLTRVVEVASVRARVKRIHMMALQTRLRAKKMARTRKEMVEACAVRPRRRARAAESVFVEAVVVLDGERFVSLGPACERRQREGRSRRTALRRRH